MPTVSDLIDESSPQPPAAHRQVGLRTCLVALVLVIALPAMLLAGWFAWYGIRGDRDVSLQRLEEAAEILSRGVEHEIEAAANGLRGLASLATGDRVDRILIGLLLPRLRATDHDEVEVIRASRQTVEDRSASGASPFVSVGGVGVPVDMIDAALRSGQPVVSNLLDVTSDPGPQLALVVPAPRRPSDDDDGAFVALRIAPELLFRSMGRPPRDDGILAALVDGQGRILARSRAQEQFIGRQVPDWARLEAIPGRRGTFQARVAERDGDVMFGFRRLDNTPGWAVVVGEPVNLYQPVWRRPLQTALVGSLLVLALAFPLAAWLARYVLRTLKGLADDAEHVAQGPDKDFRASTVQSSRIREFERLRDALARAANALQARFDAERRSARALAESERRYRTLAETGALVMWRCDPEGRFIDISGWAELIGRQAGSEGSTVVDWFDQIDPEHRAEVRMVWSIARARGTQIDVEFGLREGDGKRWVRARGAPVRDERGGIVEWVGVLEDIDGRRKAEGRVEHMIHHDHVTGLPNRAVLADRLEGAIARQSPGDTGEAFAVLFMDIDQLKLINDSLGHASGDALLCEVSRRLGAQIGPDDVLSRISSDEFVAMLGTTGESAAIEAVARRMSDAVAAPIRLADQEVNVTMTMGIATYPRDGSRADDLLSHADAAMYQCKRTGRGRFEFFAPWMNERAERRLAIESDLRRAIQQGELILYYQPKVSIGTGRVVAMEALLRWSHPGRGMIPPNEFIPFAEESGMIDELGMWVLDEACRQNRAWIDSGLLRAPVAVNWSPSQLYRAGMVDRVADVLLATGLPPEYLEFELTETALATRPEEAARVLGQLSDLGVAISIDDFGTGYSSLAYLRRLPLDKLKIDRAFIRELAANESDATIVKAVISMAHSLQMEVIAEGVEMPEQLERLRAMGCDEYQGYLCSRPIDAARFAAFVRNQQIDADRALTAR